MESGIEVITKQWNETGLLTLFILCKITVILQATTAGCFILLPASISETQDLCTWIYNIYHEWPLDFPICFFFESHFVLGRICQYKWNFITIIRKQLMIAFRCLSHYFVLCKKKVKKDIKFTIDNVKTSNTLVYFKYKQVVTSN